MKSNVAFKRIIAYIIDAIIITIITSAITYISFINPKYKEYEKVSEKYTNLMESYYNKEISIQEFADSSNDISYDLAKSGYVYIIGEIVIVFLYYGVFAFVTKGQTLGKKIMKIKIVSNKGKDLKLYQYFIRTFILNGIILNVVSLIAIFFSKNIYNTIYTYGSNVDTILLIINFLMLMFQSEGRGLQDILAGTKVVDINAVVETEEENSKEEIKEAKVVKVKKNQKNSKKEKES